MLVTSKPLNLPEHLVLCRYPSKASSTSQILQFSSASALQAAPRSSPPQLQLAPPPTIALHVAVRSHSTSRPRLLTATVSPVLDPCLLLQGAPSSCHPARSVQPHSRVA